MLYTPKIIECLRFVEELHHGQYDKIGAPYILHPVFVADQMDTEEATIVALLHDVIEDTSITLNDLHNREYSDEIVAAIDALTRRTDETYSAYIERLSNNKLARRVKIADLQHNLNPERTKMLDNASLQNRYQNALQKLTTIEWEKK